MDVFLLAAILASCSPMFCPCWPVLPVCCLLLHLLLGLLHVLVELFLHLLNCDKDGFCCPVFLLEADGSAFAICCCICCRASLSMRWGCSRLSSQTVVCCGLAGWGRSSRLSSASSMFWLMAPISWFTLFWICITRLLSAKSESSIIFASSSVCVAADSNFRNCGLLMSIVRKSCISFFLIERKSKQFSSNGEPESLYVFFPPVPCSICCCILLICWAISSIFGSIFLCDFDVCCFSFRWVIQSCFACRSFDVFPFDRCSASPVFFQRALFFLLSSSMSLRKSSNSLFSWSCLSWDPVVGFLSSRFFERSSCFFASSLSLSIFFEFFVRTPFFEKLDGAFKFFCRFYCRVSSARVVPASDSCRRSPSVSVVLPWAFAARCHELIHERLQLLLFLQNVFVRFCTPCSSFCFSFSFFALNSASFFSSSCCFWGVLQPFSFPPSSFLFYPGVFGEFVEIFLQDFAWLILSSDHFDRLVVLLGNSPRFLSVGSFKDLCLRTWSLVRWGRRCAYFEIKSDFIPGTYIDGRQNPSSKRTDHSGIAVEWNLFRWSDLFFCSRWNRMFWGNGNWKKVLWNHNRLWSCLWRKNVLLRKESFVVQQKCSGRDPNHGDTKVYGVFVAQVSSCWLKQCSCRSGKPVEYPKAFAPVRLRASEELWTMNEWLRYFCNQSPAYFGSAGMTRSPVFSSLPVCFVEVSNPQAHHEIHSAQDWAMLRVCISGEKNVGGEVGGKFLFSEMFLESVVEGSEVFFFQFELVVADLDVSFTRGTLPLTRMSSWKSCCCNARVLCFPLNFIHGMARFLK